jgi:hypothetical protein
MDDAVATSAKPILEIENLSISLSTRIGITRLANGMNQPPTVQPGLHFSPDTPNQSRFLRARCSQVTKAIPVTR